VVIIGSATVPVLRPLLMATGLAEIISWDRHDAGTFPLHWVLRNADAVIDLTDCTQELQAAAVSDPELIIINPDTKGWRLLGSPGVLRALATAQESGLDIGAYHACALALVAATPPGQPPPGRSPRP
jgi:malate dehydrogenase (oxaloacetate-decarboxylating)